MKLSIIIPAYNERATLQAAVERVEAVAWGDIEPQVIIVDDGSTDGTRAIAEGFSGRHRVLFHEANKGKAAAVRSGLAHAIGDFTIIQDADLECDPRDIKRIIDRARETGADVVYGSRQLKDPSVSRTKGIWYYQLGGLYLTTLTNILYGTSLTDEPVAYKLIRTDILKSLDLRAEGFGFCPEVTAKIAKRGIRIYEVPISYFPRSASEGKKVRFKDALAATRILIRHAFID